MSNVAISRHPLALHAGATPAPQVVLNGANVGKVTVETYDAAKRSAYAKEDAIVFIDRRGCAAATANLNGDAACTGDTLVAHGPSLTLNKFERNVLMVDGQRMPVVAIDDKVQGAGEATRRALKKLPLISSKTTVGIVSVGAVATRFALGQRNPKTLLITGAVAAGVATVGAVGLSWFRARHPDALPGWLK